MNSLLSSFFLIFGLLILASAQQQPGAQIPPVQRDCSNIFNPKLPPTAIRTTERLVALREQIRINRVTAYIIPSEDEHMSEYTSNNGKRREYISGFSGSAGLAIVTANKAAIWVDGRYYLQVEQQVDCNWEIIREDDFGTPTPAEWIDRELYLYNPVAFDPKTMSVDTFQSYEIYFKSTPKQVTMQRININLVDAIWRDQPPVPKLDLMILEQRYAGKTWQTKITDIRTKMRENAAKSLIVTELDSIAWLFNLRGNDVKYNPIFFSYAIISETDIRLYLSAFNNTKDNVNMQRHLQMCLTQFQAVPCVQLKGYDTFYTDIPLIGGGASGKIWISNSANVFINDAIPVDLRLKKASPILLMKAVKNPIEQRGMKNAHVKDAIAVIEFVTWLEKEVPRANGNINILSEISAADKLETYRRQQHGMKGLSFPTVSGFGPNGAVIHYKPSVATNVAITNKNMYLLDSGGQYLDGTTDITRTFHFGTPTAFHKEAYTRVLMGSIDLAQLIFRSGIYGRDIDVIPRAPLWAGGLGYQHGTGHGIGHYLLIHEGPARIKIGYRLNEEPLEPGMFLSDEPGYYEPNSFGVRLETIIMVNEQRTQRKFNDWTFMGFEPITLVPFEPNLINYGMLTVKQTQWLNEYNKNVVDTIRPRLSLEAKKWLDIRTRPIIAANHTNRTTISAAASQTIFLPMMLIMTVLVTIAVV